MIKDLNERTRQILKLVVDAYVETGAPVGSAAVAQRMGETLNAALSSATIRSVMKDLEARGLLYAPHTSAGRLPTDAGLSVFVDGLLELDSLTPEDEHKIQSTFKALQNTTAARHDMLEQTSSVLSGLAGGAGLVFAPKQEEPLKQIEFVHLAPGQALAILVSESGQVENRILSVPHDVTPAMLMQATNYLNARLANKTLLEGAAAIQAELARDKTQLDVLTAKVVETGVASLAPDATGGHLFVRGQSTLLEDVQALEDLERIRALMETLETKETLLKLVEATTQGDGIKIFIGAENNLFAHSGCAMIVAPCKTDNAKIVGALGVIGPARLNYGRIIPVVNYTARLMGKVLS